ncbi:MAG: signal peptidase I [Clostridia bacterium]|nr:signal peptidase I [Clostridia bacterium]
MEEMETKNQLEIDNSNIFKKPQKPTYRIESLLFLFFAIFGIIFIAVNFTFKNILIPIKVVGSSMQPTINQSITSESDDAHCDLVYYMKQNTYQPGDIVIIQNNGYANDEDVSFMIKRVVATPGQTVVFKRTSLGYCTLSVLDQDGNDTGFVDSFKKEDMYASFFSGQSFSYTVPENCYYALGDNRNVSLDSRYFGAVKTEDIAGKVKILIPYGHNIWNSTTLNFNLAKSF